MTIIDAQTIKALLYAWAFISLLASVIGCAIFHWILVPLIDRRKK